jgi:hypothetical protein
MFDVRVLWPRFGLARHTVFLAKGVEFCPVDVSEEAFDPEGVLPTIVSVYAAGPSFAGSKFLKFTTQIHKPTPDADGFISQLSRVLKEKDSGRVDSEFK